jgi:hypothetical protein
MVVSVERCTYNLNEMEAADFTVPFCAFVTCPSTGFFTYFHLKVELERGRQELAPLSASNIDNLNDGPNFAV